MSHKKTCLSDIYTFDCNNIVFNSIENGKINNTNLNFKRININVLNKDGTVGDLIFKTEDVFCFGITKNKLNSDCHNVGICLYNREPTEKQKLFVKKFNEIIEYIKLYIVDKKDYLEHYDLTINDLKKFNPLYWKKEKGKIVEGSGPILYSKLREVKSGILTIFMDERKNRIDPEDLMNKYFTGNFGLKIESIFVGSTISLIIRVVECVNVKPVVKTYNSLLTQL